MTINNSPIKYRKKHINSDTFSSQNIKSLEEAIYWSGVREVNFLDEVIVLSIKTKFDNKNYRIKDFNQVELSLILKTINENINYTSNYNYPYLTEQQATSNKQRNLEPLFEIRNKIMNENNKS